MSTQGGAIRRGIGRSAPWVRNASPGAGASAETDATTLLCLNDGRAVAKMGVRERREAR
jgi:hypothetical protein